MASSHTFPQTARKTFSITVLVMLPLFASSLLAADETENQPDSAARRGTAVSLLFGAEIGPILSQSGNTDTEASKTGYAGGGRAILNILTDKISLDGGAGWFSSALSGTAKNPAPGVSAKEEVRTRAGYAELAGRFRVNSSWELGVLTRTTFGVDSTFSTSKDAVTTPNVFAGPQVIFDWFNSRSILMRSGAFLLTDITIAGRQVVWFGLSFDLGVPLTKGDVVVKKETKVKYKERNRYIIDAEVVNFPTDSAELSEGARRYLETLGRFLVGNADVWERLVISGHADQRGSDEYNDQLAARRSSAVQEILKAQGVPEDRLVVRTLGKRDLIEENDVDIALARNRRVELYFVGKVNVKSLRSGLIKVKQVVNTPETCTDNECR